MRVDLLGRVRGALQAAGVRPGGRLVVAVSGGVDSMVLLDALARLREPLRLRLTVAHVHHGLRGRAADADAALVAGAAARLGCPHREIRLAPAGRPRGQSVQAWAREARYAALEEVRRAARASVLLTAHTRTDQAETVLLNLLRGTGPAGLAGIPPARGRILRPLLSVDRAAIAAYAARRAVAFREDVSNASTVYRRNQVRHRLLPLLAREYNPGIAESLAELATLAREDEQALEALAARLARRAVRPAGAGWSLDAARLAAAGGAVARRVFRRLVRELPGGGHGLTRRHLSGLLGLVAGSGEIRLPGGLTAWREGATIRIGPGEGSRGGPGPGSGGELLVPLPPGRWVAWTPLGWRVRIRRVRAVPGRRGSGVVWQALLAGEALQVPLVLRPWQAGDRFRPSGLNGHKKLQDLFTDLKVARRRRHAVPILVAGGRIACVVGYRIAEEFRPRGPGGGCLVEAVGTED